MATANWLYDDSMMADAWKCSDCGETTYTGKEQMPHYCVECGVEFEEVER